MPVPRLSFPLRRETAEKERGARESHRRRGRVGLADVARTLAAQLEDRRRALAGNVVTLRRGR
jgi:hypothetical protein